MSEMKIGFELKTIQVALDKIMPVKQIKNPQKSVDRYKMILASIKEVGLVEPLIVYPQKDSPGTFVLLDGHLRLLALIELGQTTVACIIASDDESFTYNARVSRLPPIQEHKMVVRAVRNGVQPERIAAALDMPLRVVIARIRLLDGIHEEAAELLKDKNICPKAVRLLKRVTGVRQIEIAELMVSVNNYFAGYAEALVLGTPKEQMVKVSESKKKEGLSATEIARMEEEMGSLEHDLKAVEESYGENVLNLTLARGYIKKLLENVKVVRFLNGYHADILAEFEAIAAAEAL
ncbi:MAG: plasmid partitioning protein RepB C-terminal domain-containing protein [Limisphaerales bacterium]